MIVDSLFGYSFKGPIRQPYETILKKLKDVKKPIFAVDIPSGWELAEGNVYDVVTPKYTISLTLPKICMKEYKGIHYLGGRFIPPKWIEERKWDVPKYPGTQQYVELKSQ
mmetsp:Transcript_3954/g.3371  ORF Transcript_3954/g.3371 Transcript_3954/m.3371 type:complete len:110 (+) Transcript_3954:475-804(+)